MSKLPAPNYAEITRIQDRAIDETTEELRTKNVVLVEAPTAAGKTRITSRVIAKQQEELGRAPKTMGLSHRNFLATQAQEELAKWAADAGLSSATSLDGKLDQSKDVNFAMVQTAKARKDDLEPVDLLVVDEGHHVSDAKSGDYKEVLDRLVELNPDMKMVLVSATWERPDKKGLSPHIRDAARVTIGWSELERAGQILLPRTVEVRTSTKKGGNSQQIAAEHYRPEKDANADGLTKALREARTESFHEEMAIHWERLNEGRQTIAYESTIAGARAFASEMRERGHAVAVVDSDAPGKENDDVLARYAKGEIQMVVSVKKIDEGINVPATRCILILRETTSEIEYSQMVGRAARAGTDPALRQVQPLVIDGGASTMIHGAIERRAKVADYFQTLERVHPRQDLSRVAATEYTPWRTIHNNPEVKALTAGAGVLFAAAAGRGADGSRLYQLLETETVRGRTQLTFLKDEQGKRLPLGDDKALKAIEVERLLPARHSLIRMESTSAGTGRSILDQKVREAADQHLASVIQFTALSQRGASR
ncbi:DEAD/DEAH box helicase [Sphingosinicella sp. BN140058]|uniref:DEAD/DEAH box helicase n=1 Tax=Sphingosinicella sp. BN140058 TaxID=1892855 RepID=UPI001011679E|nr:DEAD/DEAH box helicase [Sphingosinicella sp. BN140058]QAY80168.1 DEAD/DEAH box helicase [Sphingosinicella sp. BN140058]